MSRIEVQMPQMGESIAEGTVSRWLKKVGDEVERDEPILEISTDKVDAEIPAPTSGTLVEVAVEEGATVEVGTVIAFIDTEGGGAADADEEAADAEKQAEAEADVEQEAQGATEASDDDGQDEEAEEEKDEVAAPAADRDTDEASREETAEERLRQRSTPVVRKIAEEHGVDIAEVEGSGHAGRVTKQDILAYIEAGPEAEKEEPDEEKPEAPAPPSEPARRPAAAAPASAPPSDFWSTFYTQVEHPEYPVRDEDRVEPMDKIRRLTAEHMVIAKRVAPHVHSFIEIDFTRVARIRSENKPRWAEQGARVSYTAFVAWACSRLLPEFPTLNGTVSGNNVIYRGSVNIGIAVDLDPGLIVPVIKRANELSLVGIGRRIVDLAERARSRELSLDEIQGATFSITNPGVLGTLVGMPIIPKGTSGILGTGAIEKRPVVIEDPETGSDTIGVRMRSIFSLGYDHRLVDGADAARFLARLKETLETFPEDA